MVSFGGLGWSGGLLDIFGTLFSMFWLSFKTSLSFIIGWWSSFHRPHFGRLSCCHLLWRVRNSILFWMILSASFFVGLRPVLLFIFFWSFFVFGPFLVIVVMYFTNFFCKIRGAGVCFFGGVQKYFEKVEMMWSNFQKTRDARRDATRATRGPRRPC